MRMCRFFSTAFFSPFSNATFFLLLPHRNLLQAGLFEKYDGAGGQHGEKAGV
jgi:hypothetical protein